MRHPSPFWPNSVLVSVADPGPDYFDMDPDPAFHFDTDPDLSFHFDTDLDRLFDMDPDPKCFKELMYLT